MALDAITVEDEAPRDPKNPYAVSGSLLTTQLVWQDARDPREPYRVVASVASLPALPPPTASSPVQPRPQPTAAVYPVVAKDLFIAASPPLMIVLALGGFFGFLSILALLTALFLLSPRVSFRHKQLRVAIGISLAIYALSALVFHFVNQGMYNLDLQASVIGQVLCLLLIVVDLVLQWLGLSKGEKPDPAA